MLGTIWDVLERRGVHTTYIKTPRSELELNRTWPDLRQIMKKKKKYIYISKNLRLYPTLVLALTLR